MIVEALRDLTLMEGGADTLFIHYEIIPNSDPPFLACMYVNGVLVRPHLTGFPAPLRRMLVSGRRKVVSHGLFRESVEGRYIWGVGMREIVMMPPQYYPETYYWGDPIYTEREMGFLDMRLRELKDWEWGVPIEFNSPPEESLERLEEVTIGDNELHTVRSITVSRVGHVDGRKFFPVNLMNANLISYLKSYTFRPPDSVYEDWAANNHYKTKAAIAQTSVFQGKNHERMLARGSTQINTCTNAITVGTFVRIDSRVLNKPENYGFDPYGDSVNGSVPWSDKIYKVTAIVDGTDESPKKYVLQDLGGSYYRGMLCPIENLERGAVVRIRLSTIAKWLMANGTVKVRERHFAYNHAYSRALFRIDRIMEIPDEGKKFFLELVWSPKGTFKYSEWEVDEGRNLWSYEHYENGDKLGIKPFTGFHAADILRVDRQTEVLMRTEEGQEKYRECLLKCMNLGQKATYMDDEVSRKRMKKDPIEGSRNKKWKTSLTHNEALRRRVLAGLPIYDDIFQAQ